MIVGTHATYAVEAIPVKTSKYVLAWGAVRFIGNKTNMESLAMQEKNP